MANEAPKPPVPGSKLDDKRVGGSGEIVCVYQHSNLFYWWPVWAFGFLFATLSYFDHHYMAIVPAGSKALSQVAVEVEPGKTVKRDVVVLDEKHTHLKHKDANGVETVVEPTVHVTRYRILGEIYLIILILVIFITNITLRGLWSFFVVIAIVLLTVIFYLAGWWEIIFERLGNLSIYVNMGGYVMLSGILFALWVSNFFFLDRQLYAIFMPSQMRMRTEIGGGEMIYDTTGVVVQKQRVDLFRHWVLGFGSGDLVIRFPNTAHPIELHNILGVDKILSKIERMMQEKVVIQEATKPTAPSLPKA